MLITAVPGIHWSTLLGDNRRETVVSRGPKQFVSLNSPSVQIRITVHLSGSGKTLLKVATRQKAMALHTTAPVCVTLGIV